MRAGPHTRAPQISGCRATTVGRGSKQAGVEYPGPYPYAACLSILRLGPSSPPAPPAGIVSSCLREPIAPMPKKEAQAFACADAPGSLSPRLMYSRVRLSTPWAICTTGRHKSIGSCSDWVSGGHPCPDTPRGILPSLVGHWPYLGSLIHGKS